MRYLERIAIGAVSICIAAGIAAAADLKDAELKALLIGKTVYLDLNATGSVTGAGGQGAIYYGENGTAYYKTAKGEIWSGPFSFKDDTQCTEWKQAANNACTRYDKEGDTITLINVGTGKPRGKIIKTAPGNPEKIGP